MKAILSVIKGVVNVVLYFLYSLISIVVINWVYGFVVYKIMEKSVPSGSDPVHMKIALIVMVIILFLTILFRKFFYLRVFGNDSDIENKSIKEKLSQSTDLLEEKAKKIEKEIEKDVEDMKIYIDKEIK